MQNKNEELLKEIFMQPADAIKTDRFTEANAADCSGECSSGICRTG